MIGAGPERLVQYPRTIHQQAGAGIAIESREKALRLLRVLVYIEPDPVLATLHLDMNVQIAVCVFICGDFAVGKRQLQWLSGDLEEVYGFGDCASLPH